MTSHPMKPTLKASLSFPILPPLFDLLAGDASGDVLIFSPLNLSAISTNTELSSGMTSQGTPGSSAPKLTTPLLQTTPLPKMGRGQGTPMSASTPASRSLRVRVSARKLREIESPYSSDQSLASLQSEAIGAIPGSPAPPSQPPGGPATPPNPNLQSNEPLESSAFPRAPAPPPLSAAAGKLANPKRPLGALWCNVYGYLAT